MRCLKGRYDGIGAMLQTVGTPGGLRPMLSPSEFRVCTVFLGVMQLTPGSQGRPFVTNPSFES